MKAKKISLLVLVALIIAGCGSTLQMDRGSVQTIATLEPDQYEITGDITGEARVTMVFFFFPIGQKPQFGVLNNPNAILPYYPTSGMVESMAVYNALEKSQGADMIIAPRYEMNVTGFPPFYWKTTVSVKGKGLKLK